MAKNFIKFVTMRITFALISCILLASLFNNSNAQQVDTSYYAVLNAKEQNSRLFSGKSTTLDEKEVATLFQVYKQVIREYNKEMESNPHYKEVMARDSSFKYGFMLDEKNQYYLQFVPVINKDGDKEVWVNCACMRDGGFRKQIFEVDDGGTCFFSFTVNMKTEQYRGPFVHSSP